MSNARQLHNLINLVLAEDRTGILSVRCKLNGPVEGLPQNETLHSFSFLFRTGSLVSARLGLYQDFKVLDLVPLIDSVIKARWTPMRLDAITVTEASLSVELLAELIHNATALPSVKVQSDHISIHTPQGEGQKLLRRAHRVFSEVFGAKGEALLLDAINKVKPEANPVGFMHQCIDRLTPYLGRTNATNLMVPLNGGGAFGKTAVDSIFLG